MRPKSQKYLRRDWKRNRNYDRLKAVYGEDWHLLYHGISFYPKKIYRTTGNQAVRRYRGPLADGCEYKKIYDVQWEVW